MSEIKVIKEIINAGFVIAFIFLIFHILGIIGGLLLIAFLIGMPFCLMRIAIWVDKEINTPPPIPTIVHDEITKEIEKLIKLNKTTR